MWPDNDKLFWSAKRWLLGETDQEAELKSHMHFFSLTLRATSIHVGPWNTTHLEFKILQTWNHI